MDQALNCGRDGSALSAEEDPTSYRQQQAEGQPRTGQMIQGATSAKGQTLKNKICPECGAYRNFRTKMQRVFDEKLRKQKDAHLKDRDRLMLRAAESQAITNKLYKTVAELRQQIEHLKKQKPAG